MKRRSIALALSLALLSSSLMVSAYAKTLTQANPTQNIPVTGALPGGGTFTGNLDIVRFVTQGGVIKAVGSLTGQIKDATGAVVGNVTNAIVTLPVTNLNGTCQILHLELGPVDLNLLGLTVHLNQVVLDISAQAAPGNLLGNLLCAVAHLLDNPNASLNAIVSHLNSILRVLG